MALLTTIACAESAQPPLGERLIEDFRGDESIGAWQAVNDGVMGGLSQGGPVKHSQFLCFSGELSLENNGGFSSIRSMRSLDLSSAAGVRLRVRGDGRTFTFRFQTDARLRDQWAVAFSGSFETQKDEWTEVVVPFEGLTQSFRGYQFDQFPFDPQKIERIGIILADKKPGPFHLDIEWIAWEPASAEQP